MTDDFLFKTLVVWGPDGSGKTLFGLTSPFKPIAHLDFHGSARLYEKDKARLGLEFARFDLSEPGSVTTNEPAVLGQHWGTIVVDTIEEMWNPFLARHMATPDAQKKIANKQGQIANADAGRAFQALLKRYMNACDVLVLLAWEGEYNKEKYPKICSAARKLSDIVIRLERPRNTEIPFGLVTERCRAKGIPPRLPQATWKALAHYIQNPVDYKDLRKEEVAPEEFVPPPPAEVEESPD